MPKLNEYLGSIVSSITDARMMSDIQSVKVAKEYAKDDLLKNFAVPRMRIEEVELTIPVALETFEAKTEISYEPIDNRKFNSLVYKEVVNSIGVSKLPEDLSRKLVSEIAEKTRKLEQDIRILKTLDPLKPYVGSVLKSLMEKSDYVKISESEIDLEKVQSGITDVLSNEIKLSEKRVLENLNVIVESDKLRERKPENLLYIKIKISEEGMEWHRVETGTGKIENKLLTE